MSDPVMGLIDEINKLNQQLAESQRENERLSQAKESLMAVMGNAAGVLKEKEQQLTTLRAENERLKLEDARRQNLLTNGEQEVIKQLTAAQAEVERLTIQRNSVVEERHQLALRFESDREKWKKDRDQHKADARKLENALRCANNCYCGDSYGQKVIDDALAHHNSLNAGQPKEKE